MEFRRRTDRSQRRLRGRNTLLGQLTVVERESRKFATSNGGVRIAQTIPVRVDDQTDDGINLSFHQLIGLFH